MKTLCTLLALFLIQNSHGESTPKKNILLICVDDLRPELNCFGATYIHSPHIDALAARGRAFTRHYVNSPSCGPSRFSLLTGQLGAPSNHALFNRAKKINQDPASVPPSLPEWFRKNSYTTVSVGKVSHHPGGLGGSDWNDPSLLEMPKAWDLSLMPSGAWKHPRGAMHGLSHGKIRPSKNKKGPTKKLDAIEATPGEDSIYPDGLITQEALNQIKRLSNSGADPAQPIQPFFLAVGLIKPHLPFGAPEKYLRLYDNVALPPIPHPKKPSGKTTWSSSGEFKNQYNHHGKDPNQDPAYATALRKHYAACVSYVDASVGKILTQLKASGADQNTIVILWGDHGWNLGEHGIWGKHNLFEEALRSPLIITYPGIEAPGKPSQAIVETLDLFPTLCALTQLPQPPFAQGRSLLPQIKEPTLPGHPAVGIWNRAQTLRNDHYRFILHGNGHPELYDHRTAQKETRNIAPDHPEIVAQLTQQLKARLQEKAPQKR